MAVLVLLSLLAIFTLNSEILLADAENRCGDDWGHVKRNGSRVHYFTEGGRKIILRFFVREN